MLGQDINIDIAVGRCTPQMLVKVFAASFSVCATCKILSTREIIVKIFGCIGRYTMPILLVHNVDDRFQALFYCEGNEIRTAAARIFWI